MNPPNSTAEADRERSMNRRRTISRILRIAAVCCFAAAVVTIFIPAWLPEGIAVFPLLLLLWIILGVLGRAVGPASTREADNHSRWSPAEWSFILGAFFVVAAVGGPFTLRAQATPSDPYKPVFPAVFGALAALFLGAGFALRSGRKWARIYAAALWGLSALAVAAMGLVCIPLMTAAGIRFTREAWLSTGLTFGLVVVTLFGTLALLGAMASFLMISLNAFAQMRRVRSGEAKRDCSEPRC